MPSSRAKKLWPVPEILEGERPFTLKETHKQRGMVCTDLVGKVMTVPTGDDAFGRMGRMHEMAHVAITPTEGMQRAMDEGIGSDYINVAEDMRVNIFLQKRFTLEASIPEELFLHTVKGYILADDLKAATLMAVACEGLPECREMLNFISHEKGEWYYEVTDTVEYCRNLLDEPTFENSLEVAKWLQSRFDQALNDAIKQAVEEGDMPKSVVDRLYSYDNPDLEWGVMEIKHPALTECMAERRLNRRVKPQEMGASLMFPSRLDVDDKIFGNVKRVSKGTVLIDVSASMSLESKDIIDMVHAAPGVTVACYSGNGGGTGHLTIIASKGSMLKMDYNTHWPGANEVDGPALEWLAKQAEPRLWVCDGYVTGAGDDTAKHLTLEAYSIVAKNKIRRVEDIQDTVKFLKK